MKIIVTRDDGTEQDVTEGVQIAYDIAYGSMDWGSGFLDLAEMEAVAQLAEACGFPSYSDALNSVAETRKQQELTQARRDRQEQRAREEHQRAVEAAAAQNRVAVQASDAAMAALRRVGLA